jgi:anthranilate 1,2-dioxygenase small subunit
MMIQLQDLERFYFDYAASLDDERYEEWPEYFAQDCCYEVLSRENVEQNFPAPLMSCYSHGMVIDRVAMLVKKTLTFRMMYRKHFIANIRILNEADEHIEASANVMVIQSDLEGVSSLFIAGSYVDLITTSGARLLLRNRKVIVDSFGIDNMLAVPV